MREPGINPEQTQEEITANKRIQQIGWIVVGVVIVFLLGLGSGYLRWGQDETADAKQRKEANRIYEQISPKDGYRLSVSYGNLGPRLIESGVISYDAFTGLYENAGTPLTGEEIKALKNGSNQEIVIHVGNARTGLFSWAFARHHGIELGRSTFYSDSYNDLPLMRRVGAAIAVNPDARLRRHASRHGWRVERWV